MSDIVGIDLGTTNSLIGIVDAGFPILLADADGERLTPSVVHFPATGEPIVGRPAARIRVLDSSNTIYSAKRFIGVRGDELREEDADVPFEIARAKGQPVRVRARGRDHLPEEISALVLRKLKADAEQRARPHGVARGHHRAGVFQRRATHGDEAGRGTRWIHRRADRQRTDRGGARLRARQAARVARGSQSSISAAARSTSRSSN